MTTEGSSPSIEAFVTTAHHTAQRFLLPRRTRPRPLAMELTPKLGESTGKLLGLRLFGSTERWLLAVYDNGLFGVWDLGAGIWEEKYADGRLRQERRRGGSQVAFITFSGMFPYFQAAFVSAPAHDERIGEYGEEGSLYIALSTSR